MVLRRSCHPTEASSTPPRRKGPADASHTGPAGTGGTARCARSGVCRTRWLLTVGRPVKLRHKRGRVWRSLGTGFLQIELADATTAVFQNFKTGALGFDNASASGPKIT